MVTRRAVVLLGLLVLAVAGAGVVAAVVHDPGADVAVGAVGAGEPDTTTTSTALPTTTVAPSTTRPPAPTTVAGPTTTARRTTTTKAPAATTTSTAVRSGPACTPAQVAVAIVTDRGSYAPTQEVKVTSTLRNSSAAACTYNGYTFESGFLDSAGHPFLGPTVIADSFADVTLAPGQVLTNGAQWDHRACAEPSCAPLPAGIYTARATWRFATYTYDVTTTLILS